MNKYLILFIFIFCFWLNLFSQNHMDLLTTITGEAYGSSIGSISTTLDWNGDGYDDLVLFSSYVPQQPEPNFDGSIKVYFGGPAFDNVPDISFLGNYYVEYDGISLCNAGDMNGDGIDDLALLKRGPVLDSHSNHFNRILCIYFGGANPDTTADYQVIFPYQQWENYSGYIRSLGDINHDGFSDLGYILRPYQYYGSNSFHIIYGGTMQDVEWMAAGYSSMYGTFQGVGDVNADGIDDFAIGYASELLSGSQRVNRNVLYFGNYISVYSDSLVLFEEENADYYFFPAGDVNGDGIDDFVTYFNGQGARLYFGSHDFSANNYIFLIDCHYASNPCGFACGDINGSGMNAIVGGSVEGFAGTGYVKIWMGTSWMNAGADLTLLPPPEAAYDMFGRSITMGDYNGDGYCDIAISAPFHPGASLDLGHVYVYAGSAGLSDPVTEAVQVPKPNSMSLYPNPLHNAEELTIKFNLRSKTNQSATFTVYNIRGQKAMSFPVTAEQMKRGSVIFSPNQLATGIYICTLQIGEQRIHAKLSIVK